MGRRHASSTLVALTDRRDHVAASAAAAFDDARLTVKEAAEEAFVSEHTIRRAYVGGHLVIKRFGIGARGIRIRRGDLRAWLDAGGQTGLPPGRVR
jgi:hypothetical protein